MRWAAACVSEWLPGGETCRRNEEADDELSGHGRFLPRELAQLERLPLAQLRGKHRRVVERYRRSALEEDGQRLAHSTRVALALLRQVRQQPAHLRHHRSTSQHVCVQSQ